MAQGLRGQEQMTTLLYRTIVSTLNRTSHMVRVSRYFDLGAPRCEQETPVASTHCSLIPAITLFGFHLLNFLVLVSFVLHVLFLFGVEKNL